MFEAFAQSIIIQEASHRAFWGHYSLSHYCTKIIQTTGGPLTMAQLEYNLPILIMGSSPSTPITPQTMNATTSKSNPVVLRVSNITYYCMKALVPKTLTTAFAIEKSYESLTR